LKTRRFDCQDLFQSLILKPQQLHSYLDNKKHNLASEGNSQRFAALDGMGENLQPQGGENVTKSIERRSTRFSCGFRDEKADQHAKAALQTETNKIYKVVAEDWKNWIRDKQEGIRQAEWTSSDNPMVTVKSRFKKYNVAQALTRRDQVIISRLRMGYIRLTHGYQVDPNPSPECGDCGVRLTVDHLLWDCPTFRRQRTECNISKETLFGDEDEIRRLIRYVQKIGVYHEIINIRKRKWQTNGKTDGMGTDTANGHPKHETKNEDGYMRNYWKNLKK
jgi:hypothetical protein